MYFIKNKLFVHGIYKLKMLKLNSNSRYLVMGGRFFDSHKYVLYTKLKNYFMTLALKSDKKVRTQEGKKNKDCLSVYRYTMVSALSGICVRCAAGVACAGDRHTRRAALPPKSCMLCWSCPRERSRIRVRDRFEGN